MSAASSLLDYLPPVFSEDAFLGRFLLAFESILLSRLVDKKDQPDKGLEEAIAVIHNYFDAQNTPKEFLEWLSNLVAFSLRADWTPEQKRDFLFQAIDLYRKRGTKGYLEQILQIYTVLTPTITEEDAATMFVVGSEIGKTTQIGGGRPYHFRVEATMPLPLTTTGNGTGDADEVWRQEDILKSLINAHKPAHTTFELPPINHDTIQIEVRSTIGRDTLLGNPPKPSSAGGQRND